MRTYGILLAGGLGKRLGLMGELLPKALLPLPGGLLIDQHVDYMKEAGVDCILVVYHPVFKNQFNAWYAASKHKGISLVEQRGSDYGGGAALKAAIAETYFPKANYLVVCGDGYYPHTYTDIMKTRYASLSVTESTSPERFGTVALDGPYVVSLNEKDASFKGMRAPVSTGVYWYPDAMGLYPKSKISLLSVLDSLTKSKRGEFEISDVAKAYIAEGLVTAHPVSHWVDVGTYEDLKTVWSYQTTLPSR